MPDVEDRGARKVQRPRLLGRVRPNEKLWEEQSQINEGKIKRKAVKL